jgi:hypothetical protein
MSLTKRENMSMTRDSRHDNGTLKRQVRKQTKLKNCVKKCQFLHVYVEMKLGLKSNKSFSKMQEAEIKILISVKACTR